MTDPADAPVPDKPPVVMTAVNVGQHEDALLVKLLDLGKQP